MLSVRSNRCVHFGEPCSIRLAAARADPGIIQGIRVCIPTGLGKFYRWPCLAQPYSSKNIGPLYWSMLVQSWTNIIILVQYYTNMGQSFFVTGKTPNILPAKKCRHIYVSSKKREASNMTMQRAVIR
jgi:hypothetical protein